MKHILLIVIVFPLFLKSQIKPETFDLKNPGQNIESKCGDYLTLYNRIPIELRYSVQVVDGNIYVALPGSRYFEALFDKNSDGIAIDILRREQFKCYDRNSFARSWANRGKLLRPMYKEEILLNSFKTETGHLLINYGKVPNKFDVNEIECNLIIVQKKFLCGYHSFSNVDFENWDLLEMGLYRDSIPNDDTDQRHKEISKTLSFEIPFARNKTEFNQSDIAPLYDSLRLTDYNIIDMSIKAYTSIEGTIENNIKLQEGRATSILNSLQKFQKPNIQFSMKTNENWVEFLNDIQGSKFEYLSRLSKSEVKEELLKEDIRENLEPILSKHRKALVVLKLQKKFSSEEANEEVLRKLFDQSIANGDINEALYIQQIIFEKIRSSQIPDKFIGQLEVPQASQFGPLLNNFEVFNSEQNELFLYENINRFEELLNILPDNKKIKYNIVALKIKAWTEGELITDRTEIKSLIVELKQMNFEKSLIRRLEANYHIILTQYLQREQKFKEKSKSIKEVYWLYSRLNLSDEDLLSLSKYLSYYSRFDWAENVLSKRVNQVDVDESLVFYYLKLTINNSNKTRQSAYRSFMLNAIDKNNQRFCDLFLPKPQGGYTFQMLGNEFIRKTYCENCHISN